MKKIFLILIVQVLLFCQAKAQHPINKQLANRHQKMELKLTSLQKIRVDSINNATRQRIMAIPANLSPEQRKGLIDAETAKQQQSLKELLTMQQYQLWLKAKEEGAKPRPNNTDSVRRKLNHNLN